MIGKRDERNGSLTSWYFSIIKTIINVRANYQQLIIKMLANNLKLSWLKFCNLSKIRAWENNVNWEPKIWTKNIKFK